MTASAAKFDELLTQAVAAGDVPGAAVAVLGPDGVVYEGVAGRVRIDRSDEVTPDTVFWLASMTKALGAVGVLQLVERGRLDLDAEVASIVPEFGELQVLEGFDGDEPRLRAREARGHRAPTAQPHLRRGVRVPRRRHGRWYEVAGVAGPLGCSRDFLRAPLVADPGTEWNYGTGLDWAGRGRSRRSPGRPSSPTSSRTSSPRCGWATPRSG